MTTAEKLRANIRAHMKDHGNMSIRALARAAEISKSALSDFLAEKNSSLTFDSMAAIAVLFNTSVGALLGEEPAVGPLRMIAYTSIHPSELNPRKHFNQADIEKLAHDIKKKSVLQNLIVRADPDAHGLWLLVAGERRLKAVDLLVDNGEWSADCTLPCRVIVVDDMNHILTALAENLERVDLDPLEEAGAYQRLVEDYGMTPLQIGGRFARDKRHIQYRLNLLKLSVLAKTMLGDGKIGPSVARQIVRLEDKGEQNIICNLIAAGTLEASEAAVTRAVNESRGAHSPWSDQADIEDPSTNAQDEAPQTAEQHRHDYPGDDAEAWIRAKQMGNDLWGGYLHTPFSGDITVPFDWPTPQVALGAAASCLASNMRNVWAGADTSPPDRVTARAIMEWANSMCVRYGNPPIPMPGQQEPADPPAEDPSTTAQDEAASESNEEIAAHALAEGVERRDQAEDPPVVARAVHNVVEIDEDGWPIPKPGEFIEHPRAVDPEYQFISVTMRGIGDMPVEITLYDPRNQAHAEYVRKEE